ncbi:uncharacterized protein LOC131597469 [Vicia villosa]|uniref:uncharacterized protein LOC131597469 n=1 Tax=Vicia villosa TaxID=3911 RepID=UPI00273B0ECC|nr:uncharacterized protein LOC131597469 [Vicia villosa]
MAIGYQQITRFAELVNKSRIFDVDSRESASHYKSLSDKNGKGKFCGKPYGDKRKEKVGCDKKSNGGGAPTLIRCYWSDKTKNKQAKGEVLFSGSETATDDRLIRDTHAMSSMTTSFVCLNCSLSIFGRYFRIDLACLPLDKLDVFLRMNWLEYNRFYINSFDKTIIFPGIGVEEDFFCLPTIVLDFSEVFPEDVSDLLSKHEVEFMTDLDPRMSPVSIDPY